MKSGLREKYQILVEGHLDPSWSDRLGGFSIESSGSEVEPATTLTGAVADQAALRGILDALMDLGYTVVSVERLRPREMKYGSAF